MTSTVILFSLAFFGALGILVAIVVCIYASTEPRSYYNCCNGKCNQGRDCPARVKDRTND